MATMENKFLKISMWMALFMGVFLPLAETIRRSNQLLDPARFINWFDDYLLGGALLIAVYLVKKMRPNSISYLIAAWGVAVGALFLSFIGQFEYYETATGDPGIFSTTLAEKYAISDAVPTLSGPRGSIIGLLYIGAAIPLQ